MGLSTAEEVYDQVVSTLPPAEQLRLVGEIAQRLAKQPAPKVQRSYTEVVARIRERQRARGHTPRGAEEVDSEIRREREAWGD